LDARLAAAGPHWRGRGFEGSMSLLQLLRLLLLPEPLLLV
jgi:hypothetical protein